jgi:hypothetical protein
MKTQIHSKFRVATETGIKILFYHQYEIFEQQAFYLNIRNSTRLWPRVLGPSSKIEIPGFAHHHYEISDP